MSKVAKATTLLMIATILAKILGFGRELVLASSYGTSMYSDAYLTAMNIPLVILTIIGTTLGTVLIPMYFEVNDSDGEKGALKYMNNIFNIVIVVSIILSILGILFTEEIVKVFAIGFEGERLKVAIEFTRVTILGIIFTALSYVITAYLQIKNNFVVPGIITVPKNIIVIISIILSTKYNPYIMIWGTLIGTSMELLFQIPFAIKKGYKYKLYININDKFIKKTLYLIAPVLIGVSVNQINIMVDKTLASTLAEGSISALNYANKLNGFVTALFITSITAVIYPRLAKLSSEDNKKEFVDTVVQSINSIIILVIPISVGAMVLSTPIVKLLFQRGAFDDKATSMTSIALTMYSIGMVAYGLRDILGKVFYSLQDTKTPMVNGIISMVMNITMNILFIRSLKIAGLALATSLSTIMCVLLLFVSLRKKVNYFGQDRIIRTTTMSIISAILMGICTYFTNNMLSNMLGAGMIMELISLSLSVIIGAIIYLILIVILKVEEIDVIKKILKDKLDKKSTITT